MQVIAEPTRRRILDHVREHDRSVGELVQLTGMHQPGVSRHLRVLRDAGLVDVRVDAQRRIYHLRAEPLAELDAWLSPVSGALVRPPRRARTPSRQALRSGASRQHRSRPEGDPMTTSPLQPSADPDGTIEPTDSGGVIRFERRLPYPVADVWSAITEPARLADWWLPFEADITVDLQPGGLMVMTATGDEPMTITCEILRVQPPHLLEHTHVDEGLPGAVGARDRRRRMRPPTQPLRARSGRSRSRTATPSACTRRSTGSARASPERRCRGTGTTSPITNAATQPLGSRPSRRTDECPTTTRSSSSTACRCRSTASPPVPTSDSSSRSATTPTA